EPASDAGQAEPRANGHDDPPSGALPGLRMDRSHRVAPAHDVPGLSSEREAPTGGQPDGSTPSSDPHPHPTRLHSLTQFLSSSLYPMPHCPLPMPQPPNPSPPPLS